MRRHLTCLATVLFATAGLIVLSGGTAQAEPVCTAHSPRSGVCLVWVEVPAGPEVEPVDDGPRDTGSGAACYWDPSKQGVTSPPPGPVPCTNDAGYWSNAYNCYIHVLDPQPAPGDPLWQGHSPSEGGQVYECWQPFTDYSVYQWLLTPPAPSGSGPSPRAVAELAIDQMELRAIDIGIAPEPGDDSVGVVGMPVWMWVAVPDQHTFGPVTASASAGGITVTATATVHRIVWDMGDGNQVVCTTKGTPYDASRGGQASPDCGHVYDQTSAGQPNQRFTVTATSDWVIVWEGAGQTGTIRMNGLSRSAQIAVGEAQVLVTS
ncbi:hypothetical protein [Georgenia yuyongxinii]|uniref:ATP/GTP-binding protein n=1 Tax=Georgenia yuyongxinii TaxID=2589797 RepID=A0A552WXE0_9MICO|nr:hypothetical protein [Georgenia yuyongxinii]TRW47447.1 hypothetical protein FJ693_01205 [Georgenia yuyongxinii]